MIGPEGAKFAELWERERMHRRVSLTGLISDLVVTEPYARQRVKHTSAKAENSPDPCQSTIRAFFSRVATRERLGSHADCSGKILTLLLPRRGVPDTAYRPIGPLQWTAGGLHRLVGAEVVVSMVVVDAGWYRHDGADDYQGLPLSALFGYGIAWTGPRLIIPLDGAKVSGTLNASPKLLIA